MKQERAFGWRAPWVYGTRAYSIRETTHTLKGTADRSSLFQTCAGYFLKSGGKMVPTGRIQALLASVLCLQGAHVVQAEIEVKCPAGPGNGLGSCELHGGR